MSRRAHKLLAVAFPAASLVSLITFCGGAIGWLLTYRNPNLGAFHIPGEPFFKLVSSDGKLGFIAGRAFDKQLAVQDGGPPLLECKNLK